MTLPWPGEQLDLYDGISLAGSLTGFAIWEALRKPDTTHTITAASGEDFYILSDTFRTLLITDSIGECNWLIDVDSGSATVDMYTGFADNWDYDPPTPTWTLVGTMTLNAGRHIVPLPMGDRTFTRFNDDGAPALRFNVTAGSAVISSTWLQIEPPDGLKEYTSTTTSAWHTPPTTFLGPARQLRQYGQLSSISSSHYSGTYNDQGTSGADITLSPTWLAKINAALGNATGLTPSDTGWVTSSATFAVGGGISCSIEDFNHQAVTPGPPGFDYLAHVSVGWNSMKALWTNYTAERSTSGRTGINGRDYVGVEYNGNSSSIGWKPGFIVPVGTYGESKTTKPGTPVTSNVPGASPHGESYSLSGTASDGASGSAFPENAPPVSLQWPIGSVSGVISLTPTAGSDVELDATVTPMSSFTNPNVLHYGQYTTSSTDYIGGAGSSITWYWAINNGAGAYLWSSPAIEVQPPDWRDVIPVWVPSADAVGPPAPQVDPRGGYYVIPDPNLDGQGDGVKVAFAGTV